MSGVARVADGLDRTVSSLEQVARAMLLTVLVVALACVCVLFIAATYGILHNGDDFDFGNGGVGGGGGGGDIIRVPAGLF
jgi:hypothetical protein